MLYIDSPELGQTITPVYRNLHHAKGIRILLRLHERGYSRTTLDFDVSDPRQRISDMKVLKHVEFHMKGVGENQYRPMSQLGRIHYMASRTRYPDRRTVLREHQHGFSHTVFDNINSATETLKSSSHAEHVRADAVSVDSFGHKPNLMCLWHASGRRFNFPSKTEANAIRQGADRHVNGALGLWCGREPSRVKVFGQHLYKVLVDAQNIEEMSVSDLHRYHTEEQIQGLKKELQAAGADVLLLREASGIEQAVVLGLRSIYLFEEDGPHQTDDLLRFSNQTLGV